jgi:hypothetical protein
MTTYNPNATPTNLYPQFRKDYDRVIMDLTTPDGKPSKGTFLLPSDSNLTYAELIEMMEGLLPEGYKLMSYSFQHLDD